MRGSLRPILAVLSLSFGGAGCASEIALATSYAQLESDIQAVHTLSNCAPRDLALADANYQFAQIEFDEGDVRRASEHVAIARTHVAVAQACAPTKSAPAPKPKSGDGDRDGVVDTDDTCPKEAEDLDGYRDMDGCPELDNDGDGQLDPKDKCPNEAEDRDSFQDDDGCPELDNDADGLADTMDGCPNDVGTQANKGCPILDADGDGVNDDKDTCPTQPETKNEYLDTDGCPDEKPQRVEVTATQIIIKQRINFATGKATILGDSFPVLDDVVLVMRDYPLIHVEIGGHTDNVGDDTLNQRLSKNRADAVFEYLLAHGVRANRLLTIGHGETRPIDTNMTDDGKLANRRVEFIIVDPALNTPR